MRCLYFCPIFLFQPVRAALKARQERIAKDAQTAEHEKEEARKLKMTYEEKIKSIEEEAQEIMFRARQKALKSEQDMLKKAGREAEWIKEKAKIQIELERKKEADEKKKRDDIGRLRACAESDEAFRDASHSG